MKKLRQLYLGSRQIGRCNVGGSDAPPLVFRIIFWMKPTLLPNTLNGFISAIGS